jgi:hypothetical protein
MAATAEQAAQRHARAQDAAMHWAERAEVEYAQAIRHEDDARARQHHESSWQRDRLAEDRRLAQAHGTRCTEALRLAEMWARVAAAVVPPLEPAWSTLESTDG